MKISMKNLRKYLKSEISAQEIAATLTKLGLEVEEVYDVHEKFAKFKVVQVISAVKHPNADKLRLCEVVDAVGQQSHIVCGAQNVYVGMKTVCATPGAIVPAGNFVIKKSKIRGEVSEGMLCSYSELQLDIQSDGIIDLPQDTSLSASVDEAIGLDEGYLDISITPNRADCMSAYGIARELASAGCGTLQQPACTLISDEPFAATVYIDPLIGIHKLFLRTICGIDNKQQVPLSCGQQCLLGKHNINAVVDLANMISDELGVPFHVYDMDKIRGYLRFYETITREEFVDFAGTEYMIPEGVLVASDERSVACIIGISGSKDVACDANTRNIMIECACLDNQMIACNGSKMAIKTDSRTRFERGVDDQMCELALNILSSEIKKICGGTVSSIYNAVDEKREVKPVTLHKQHAQRIIGDVDFAHVQEVLRGYGFALSGVSEEECTVAVPSHRYDIQIPEDLVEEYMRLVGYDKFPVQPLTMSFMPKSPEIQRHYRLHDLRKMLVSYGLYDVISYSFVSKEHAEVFSKGTVELLNPITQTMSTMRPSLLINLLRFSVTASHYGVKDMGMFEIGPVFSNDMQQHEHLAIVRYGCFNKRSWLHEHRAVDVFDIKADLLSILEYFGVSRYDVTLETSAAEQSGHDASQAEYSAGASHEEHYHPYRSAKVLWGNVELGRLGQIHPILAKHFGCANNTVMMELNLEPLLAQKMQKQKIVDKHMQTIQRDFSFAVPQDFFVEDLLTKIYHLSEMIVDVNIFDCYKMPDQQQSLGISVSIQPCASTMTEDELHSLSQTIVELFGKKGGVLRDK